MNMSRIYGFRTRSAKCCVDLGIKYVPVTAAVRGSSKKSVGARLSIMATCILILEKIFTFPVSTCFLSDMYLIF